MLVAVAGGQLAVQRQQAVEQDVLVREAAERLYDGVARRHLHVLAVELVRRLRPGRPSRRPCRPPGPEGRVRLQVERLADPQQLEGGPFVVSSPGAAVFASGACRACRCGRWLTTLPERRTVSARCGRGPRLGLDLRGGQLAHAVGARVRVLLAAARQRHGQSRTRRARARPPVRRLRRVAAPGNRSHRSACLLMRVPRAAVRQRTWAAHGPRVRGGPSGPLTRAARTGTG